MRNIEYPTIEIVCPLKDRQFTIDRYLQGIYNLDYPKDKISIHWLLNDSTDLTQSYLKDFKMKHSNEYAEIKIDKIKLGKHKDTRFEANSSTPRFDTYHRLSALRNYLLDTATTDYIFSIDSDIIVPSNALKDLLSANVDYISAVVNNDSINRPNETYPNIRTNVLRWRLNGSPDMVEHWLDFPLNEIIEVGCTGAVMLLSKKAYTSARFGFDCQGEDVFLCRELRDKGIKIYAHTGVWCEHIMVEYQKCCLDGCQNPCVILNTDKGQIRIGKFKYEHGKIYPDILVCPNKNKQTNDKIFIKTKNMS